MRRVPPRRACADQFKAEFPECGKIVETSAVKNTLELNLQLGNYELKRLGPDR